MSVLSRLFGTAPDPREGVRPLWHRVIELARDPVYYADCRVADSVAGRFDMITGVLSAVMVRLEASQLRAESALLAELFVEDMDGQLREFGINDVVVGKRIGKLMSVLGGRLGAYRGAYNEGELERLTAAVSRNVTFAEGTDEAVSARAVADRLMKLFNRLGRFSDAELMQASAIW
jgi:cytochrome b pre-mRNA-processing protein 3